MEFFGAVDVGDPAILFEGKVPILDLLSLGLVESPEPVRRSEI